MKKLLIGLCLISALATHSVEAKGNIDLGIAYDLDVGVTAQFSRYSLFLNGDAAAFDVRLQNFYNDSKSLILYIDAGAFFEDREANNDVIEDRVGIRLPLGLQFGLDKNLYAYVQAVPHYDFNNDNDFDVDGAIGLRYRF